MLTISCSSPEAPHLLTSLALSRPLETRLGMASKGGQLERQSRVMVWIDAECKYRGSSNAALHGIAS